MSSSPTLPPGAPFRFRWGAVAGVIALALAGIALLTAAIYNALGGFNTTVEPTPTRLAVASVAPLILPTVTLPPPTATMAALPTETPEAEQTATAAPQPAAVELLIIKPANVRSGPGFDYPVIGGLEQGAAPKLLGRSAAGDWFVIAYAAASGQGWVSALVAEYKGDVSALPVIAAPPKPLPSRTSPPPAAPSAPPPPVIGSRGLTGQLALCVVKPSYAARLERICFRETLKNNTANTVTYGLLGVHAANLSGGPSLFHTSWRGDLGIGPGCIGPTDRCGGSWEDGMFIDSPGTYRLTLQICYSDENTCQGPNGEWETLTPGIDIVVVNWTP